VLKIALFWHKKQHFFGRFGETCQNVNQKWRFWRFLTFLRCHFKTVFLKHQKSETSVGKALISIWAQKHTSFLSVIFERPFHVGIKWATQFFKHVFDSKIKCTKLYWCPLLGSFSGLKVDEKDMISTLFFKNTMLWTPKRPFLDF
jgi:hypothetical protein